MSFGENFWEENSDTSKVNRDFFDSFKINKDTIGEIGSVAGGLILLLEGILKEKIYILFSLLIILSSSIILVQKIKSNIKIIPIILITFTFIFATLTTPSISTLITVVATLTITFCCHSCTEQNIFNQSSHIVCSLSFFPIPTLVLFFSKYTFNEKLSAFVLLLAAGVLGRIIHLHIGPLTKDLIISTKRAQMLTRIANNTRNIQEREPEEVVRGIVEIIMNLGAKSCHFLSADRRFNPFQMGDSIDNVVEISKKCIDDGKIVSVKNEKNNITYGVPIRLGSRFACAIIVKLAKVPAYESSLLEAYEILAAQAGRALDNANLTAQDRRLVEQLKDESLQDQLSGLGNRRFAEQSMSQLKVGDIVVMIDVDGLKIANDTYGHSAGDEIIKNVGIFLKQNIRNPDVAARIGGDEFLLILKNADKGAAAFLDRIRSAWASYHIYNTSFSVGYSIHEFGNTPQSTLQKADSGLYSSKKEGKNKVTGVA